MYYYYDEKNSIKVPAPFGRTMTPIFMGDDPIIPDTNVSVHMVEWEPGCQADEHTHDSAMELMYCVAGTGTAQVNGEEHPFFPGAMIVAPKNVVHQISNTGNEMLRVLCIYSPAVTTAEIQERAMKAIAEAEFSKKD